MKSDKLTLAVGITLILCAISIFVSDWYFERTMLDNIRIALEKSKVTISTEKNNTSSSTLIDVEDSFESLSEDQDIIQVETYTNVIEIPSLNILAYINKGTDKSALASGVGWHESTTEIGDIGNTVIAGHASDIYKCIFNKLKEIQILDTFYVYDKNGIKHLYYVTDKFIVDPSDTSILRSGNNELSQITIYTCTERGTRRLVVVGKEFNDLQLEQFKAKLKEKYIIDMVSINDTIIVSDLASQFSNRLKPVQKTYYVTYIDSGKALISTRNKLYYPILIDLINIKSHDFTGEYINVGFRGGLVYDLSTN